MAKDPRSTSVYLPDAVKARWRAWSAATGGSLGSLVERGLDSVEGRSPDEVMAAAVAEAVRDELREIVRGEVRAALRDAHGGGL